MGRVVAERITTQFTGRAVLPVFPPILERLLDLRHSPATDGSPLSRILKLDPVLCYQGMRLDRCRSPMEPAKALFSIDAVVDRIGMTGLDAILSRALDTQVFNGVVYRQGLALEWLWRHSLNTALLSQSLAQALNQENSDEAYIAGLLHNIGKLALYGRTPETCISMLADPVQAVPLLKAEENVAGYSDDHIGADLIGRHTQAWWAADAIRHHSVSANQIKQALPLVQILWSANRLAVEPYPSQKTYRSVASLLEIDPKRLSEVVSTCNQTMQAITAEFGQVPHPVENADSQPINTTPLARHLRIEAILSPIFAHLMKADDNRAIFEILQQSLCALMGIDAIIMVACEHQGDHLIGTFTAGCAAPLSLRALQIPVSASDCLPVVCRSSGTTVDSFSHAKQSPLTIADQQLIRYTGTDGIVCIPVRSGLTGRWVCLILGVDNGDWPWVQRHQALISGIVNTVVAALDKKEWQPAHMHRQSADQGTDDASRIPKLIHEVNNPLSIIKNYLNILKKSEDTHNSVRETLDIIDAEINRVTELVQSLTLPVDNHNDAFERIDLNATIAETLDLFRNSVSSSTAIQISQDLDGTLPMIPSDPNRLKQTLINLLKNAMEAMPSGGRIQVTTRMLNAIPGTADTLGGQDVVRLSVCDDGPGFDEGLKNDLFRPHVTSKARHSGLGLPIVVEMVTHLNGTLKFESGPGRGTCFHIELPAGP